MKVLMLRGKIGAPGKDLLPGSVHDLSSDLAAEFVADGSATANPREIVKAERAAAEAAAKAAKGEQPPAA